MSNTQQQLESQIREKTTEYEQIQNRLRQLQSEVDDMQFSRSSTDTELQSVTQSLKGRIWYYISVILYFACIFIHLVNLAELA